MMWGAPWVTLSLNTFQHHSKQKNGYSYVKTELRMTGGARDNHPHIKQIGDATQPQTAATTHHDQTANAAS
jgi:hypothetical protein